MNKQKALASAEKYILKGKIPAAIDKFRQAVEYDPGDTTTINTLGDLYLRVGRIDAAIENFFFIADTYFREGFIQKATAMLKKIEKVDPQNLDVAKRLARIYARQGRVKEARERYLRLAEISERRCDRQGALENYQEVIHLDPTDAAVYAKIGELFALCGSSGRAQEAYLRAGEEFERKGLQEPALTAYAQVLAFAPQDLHALGGTARLYLQKGQPERAVELLGRAFKRVPWDVELLILTARTYLHAGMDEEAEEALRAALRLDKTTYELFFELGEEYVKRGDLGRAAASLDGCWEVLFARSDESRAEGLLRCVLDSEPYHREALERLVKLFRRTGEDGKLLVALKTLSEVAQTQGDEETAIATLEEAVRLQTNELERGGTLPVQEAQSAGGQSTAAAPSLRITLSVPTEKNFEMKCHGIAPPATTLHFYEGRTRESAQPTRLVKDGGPRFVALSEVSHLPGSYDDGLHHLAQQALAELMANLDGHGLITPAVRAAYQDAAASLERINSLGSSADPDLRRALNQTAADIVTAFSTLLQLSLCTDGKRLTDISPSFAASSLPGPIGIVGSGQTVVKLPSDFSKPLYDTARQSLLKGDLSLANRRRVERQEMRLPVRVISPQKGWQQYTQSLDVSPLGVRFKLLSPVRRGAPLRVELPLPRNLRVYESDEGIYVVNAVVCHVEQAENQEYLVGAEFGSVG